MWDECNCAVVWTFFGIQDFTGGSYGKESACNVRDWDSIPGLGRSPGEGNTCPLQCSGLENSMDRGAWQPIVHGVTKTQLNNFHFTSHRQMKQIRKVKKLNKWVSHELTTNQKKIIVLKCYLLLFCATIMNHFSIGLWCVTKSEFYMTTSDDQLSGWTEKKLQSTSQSQTYTKKKKGLGHCPVVWCWSNPLQLSESQWNHYTC